MSKMPNTVFVPAIWTDHKDIGKTGTAFQEPVCFGISYTQTEIIVKQLDEIAELMVRHRECIHHKAYMPLMNKIKEIRGDYE